MGFGGGGSTRVFGSNTPSSATVNSVLTILNYLHDEFSTDGHSLKLVRAWIGQDTRGFEFNELETIYNDSSLDAAAKRAAMFKEMAKQNWAHEMYMDSDISDAKDLTALAAGATQA